MSIEKAKAYLAARGYADRLVVHDVECDTVAHAAAVIGCEEKQIAKTMTFLSEEGAVAIVTAGDARIKNGKYKAYFGTKAKMVPFEDVTRVIGHEPGGVCPFGLADGVRVFLDISLRRFDTVHAAGGGRSATVRLSPDELEAVLPEAPWVDLCDGWCDDEAAE
ncbi:MAG: YbaK/EbsC family protein [Ruminococcaceae bacterium]|nr:YbaK/EbsC family protein [Oscillospiraceae bacterium]